MGIEKEDGGEGGNREGKEGCWTNHQYTELGW